MDAMDWESVVGDIQATGIKQCDAPLAANMVLKALKRWGPTDLDGLLIDRVESRFLLVEQPNGYRSHLDVTSDESRAHGHRSLKGFVDLSGVDGEGRRVVIDWKTVGTITPEKQSAQRASWQGPIYAYATGADKIVYRLLQRDERAVEIRLDWPTVGCNNKDVERHITQCLDLRESLLAHGTWIQHKPYACNAYGRPCPHFEPCAVYNAPTRVEKNLGPLSYSGMETLLLCPERYRRDALTPETESSDRNDATDLGTALHAGVANVWRQLSKLQHGFGK